MLEEDGNVLSPGEIVRRVKVLIRESTKTSSDSGSLPSTDGADGKLDLPGRLPRQSDRITRAFELHGHLSPPEVSAGGAVGTLKRVVRRAIAWFVEPRFQALSELDGVQNDLLQQHLTALSQVEEQLGSLNRQLKALKRQVNGALPTVYRVLDHYESLSRNYAESIERASFDFERVLLENGAFRELRSEVEKLGYFAKSIASELNRGFMDSPEVDYLAFENQFRGSEESISESQWYYVQFIPETEDPRPLLDIGCGRGEMLSTLSRLGHVTKGVDLDREMVQLCVEKGLDVSYGNAIDFLRSLEDGHLKGIFCSQVVEHLSTPELKVLIQESARTIGVGGVAIFETIDPRSLFALGNHFYADLTHVRPVHPYTLKFLCESLGFDSAEVIGRSPHKALDSLIELPEDIYGQTLRRLMEDFYGYQDFAIVARR